MSGGAKFWIILAAILGLLAYAHQSRTPEPKRWCPGTRTWETTASCFLLAKGSALDIPCASAC
jgi:hypothetical protein